MRSSIFILTVFSVMAAVLSVSAAAFPFTVDGNKVYINDSNVYLETMPHTVADSGYVYLTLQSKVFTGDVNAVFGFDTTNAVPKSIDLYNPHNVEYTKSYTCEGDGTFYNYTLTPKVFYCWFNDTFNDGMPHSNKTILMFSHSFDTANATTKTAYWRENRTEDWTSIAQAFSSVNYNFDGKNKWYYASNIPITQGQTYKVRLWLDVKLNRAGKYDFAIYPSSYGLNIGHAISNGHFYYLDPWYNASWQKKIQVNFTNNNVSLPYYAYEMVFTDNQLDNGDAGTNGRTIRVINETEDGTIDFFIDYFGKGADGNTSIWINLTNNTKMVWIYYQNDDITTSTSNGSKVFDLAFDDGEEGIGKWALGTTTAIGTTAVVNGITLGSKSLQINITGADYSPTRIPFTAITAGYVRAEYYINATADTTGSLIVCAATATTNCYAGFQNDWLDNSGSSPKNRYVHYAAGTVETLISVVNVTGGGWYKVGNVYNLTAANRFGTFYINETGNLQTLKKTPNLANSGARSNQNIGFVGFAAGSGTHKAQIDNYKVFKALPNITSYPAMTVSGVMQNSAPYIAVTLQSPTNSTYNTLNISLAYTIDVNVTVDKCRYELNGAANVSLPNCANTTFLAAQGNNVIKIFANTTGGLLASDTESFSADSIFPQVSIQQPTNITYDTPTRTLNYTASDNLGIQLCIRELNGANTTLAGCANGTFTAVAGLNVLKIYVNDSAGNKNVSTVSFTYAPANIRVTIQSPTNTTILNGNVSLLYTIFVDNTTLAGCWYKLDNDANITLPLCANTTFSASSIIEKIANIGCSLRK